MQSSFSRAFKGFRQTHLMAYYTAASWCRHLIFCNFRCLLSHCHTWWASLHHQRPGLIWHFQKEKKINLLASQQHTLQPDFRCRRLETVLDLRSWLGSTRGYLSACSTSGSNTGDGPVIASQIPRQVLHPLRISISCSRSKGEKVLGDNWWTLFLFSDILVTITRDNIPIDKSRKSQDSEWSNLSNIRTCKHTYLYMCTYILIIHTNLVSTLKVGHHAERSTCVVVSWSGNIRLT